jgi:hypothetical protein
MTHDRNEYPTQGFYVAHKRFLTLDGKPWGDVLDGPQVDDEAVVEAIIEAWKDEGFLPCRNDCRVWRIVLGKPAEDCTQWAIDAVADTIAESLGLDA